MNKFIYLHSIFLLFTLSVLSTTVQAGTEPGKPGKSLATKPMFMDAAPNDTTVSCVDNIPAPVSLNATDDNDLTFPKLIAPVDSPNPATLNRCTGGIITRRWIAVDMTDMLADTLTQIITIAPDIVKPTLPVLLELNKTEQCDTADYTTWLNSLQLSINTNAIDCNLNLAGITNNAPAAFNAKCDSSIIITFTVPDMCGNTATFLATYTIVDTTWLSGFYFDQLQKPNYSACADPNGDGQLYLQSNGCFLTGKRANNGRHVLPIQLYYCTYLECLRFLWQ